MPHARGLGWRATDGSVGGLSPTPTADGLRVVSGGNKALRNCFQNGDASLRANVLAKSSGKVRESRKLVHAPSALGESAASVTGTVGGEIRFPRSGRTEAAGCLQGPVSTSCTTSSSPALEPWVRGRTDLPDSTSRGLELGDC